MDWRALPRARSPEKGSGISNTPCIRFATILYIYIVGKVSFSRLQVLTASRKIPEGTDLQNAKYMRITKLKHFGSEPPLLGFLFLLLETLYTRIHHSVNRLYVVTSSLYKRPTTVPDHFCGPAPLPYTPNCCILLLSLFKCNFLLLLLSLLILLVRNNAYIISSHQDLTYGSGFYKKKKKKKKEENKNNTEFLTKFPHFLNLTIFIEVE